MELQKIKCTNPLCQKVLCESSGEVKKICPKCGETTHVVITSKGIINLGEKTKGDKVFE